jgi:hypothetical protein
MESPERQSKTQLERPLSALLGQLKEIPKDALARIKS